MAACMAGSLSHPPATITALRLKGLVTVTVVSSGTAVLPAESRAYAESTGDKVTDSQSVKEGPSAADSPELPSADPEKPLPGIPPWEIDKAPSMLIPGSLDSDINVIAMMDALPLTASVYLNAEGEPYLVIYTPHPENCVAAALNGFFVTAVYSPAEASGRPVPSLLQLPVEIQRPG